MDTSYCLKRKFSNGFAPIALTLHHAYHAFLLGLNACMAEYHFRKEHEANFDKRRRDERRHREARAKHLSYARYHHWMFHFAESRHPTAVDKDVAPWSMIDPCSLHERN